MIIPLQSQLICKKWQYIYMSENPCFSFFRSPSCVSQWYMAAAVECKIARYRRSLLPSSSCHVSCITNQNMRLYTFVLSVATTPTLLCWANLGTLVPCALERNRKADLVVVKKLMSLGWEVKRRKVHHQEPQKYGMVWEITIFNLTPGTAKIWHGVGIW